MKKLFISLGVVLIGLTVNAQNFNLGISAGLPSGDASDAYSFSAHLDASYLWEISEGLTVGAASGFLYSFGDSIGMIDFDDVGYIPLAVAGRYALAEGFIVGADVGYGLGVTPSDLDSGFYYAPRAQYSFSDMASVVLAYRSVSVSGGSFDFLTLGVEFKL